MYKYSLYAVLISLAFCAYADTVFQTDWSEGSGEPGPVPQWLSSFEMGSGVDIFQTGFIEMGTGVVSYDENIVSPNFGSYGYTVPGDFDGDGDIDIICDDMDEWKFYLFENLDGVGTQWQAHFLFNMPYIPNKAAEAVDLDMDGDLDLLTATGPFFTFWENSDATGLNWERHTISGIYGDACDIASVDIDNDGDLDVIGTDNQLFHLIAVWENLDGIGSEWQEHIVTQLPNKWPMYIQVADIDNDNDQDFFFNYRNSNPPITGWFENLGSWEWKMHIICTAPESQGLSAADYDNDGLGNGNKFFMPYLGKS